MIYFDNAATGGFKPSAVIDAATTAIRYLNANPGRSGHRLSVTGAKAVYECRRILSEFFSCPAEKVIFTKNCTEALNLAIFGTARKKGHVITTALEHNSVLRPLNYLQHSGKISLDVVTPSKPSELVELIKNKIKDDTYLVVCTAVSNVTGCELPLEEIGKLCKTHGIIFLVDGAQGGGHIPLDMAKLNVDLLALAGHKGLSGIMGSGALLINDETQLSPLIHGGTGTQSLNLFQPQEYPEKLEAGTLNLPAITALSEGVKFVGKNLENFGRHLLSATGRLIDGLEKIKGVKIYSTPNRSGIVAFSVGDKASTDVADILSQDYDVAVRGGMHCSPLTHKLLGSLDGGLVRASLAVQNSFREIDYFIKAITQISLNSF